jgi:cyanate permease
MHVSSASTAEVNIPVAKSGRQRINWSAWINVFVGAVIMVATLPGRTQGLGLITEPMLAEFGLDRVTYANINLWATLLGAAICLPIGQLFDRLGLRSSTIALTLLLSAVVWGMRSIGGSVIGLFVLILATRAIGQSALSIASITAVGKTFDRRVGVAMGVYSFLLSVFFAIAFIVIGNSVRVNGWRYAWSQVAFGLVAAAALTVFLRERTPRRSANVALDEGATDSVDSAEAASDGLTLGAALRTPAFWVFGGATALFGLVASGLGLFNEAVLAERGFDQQTYVQFLAGTSIIALVGQLASGWLTLRWPMQRLLGIALCLYAVAIGALPLLRTHAQLWFFAVLIGLGGGMITTLFFAVWRRAFGAAHLGRIQGAAQMLTVLASAIGPLIFAYSQSLTGSYFPALWVLAPAVLLMSAAAFRVSLPSPRLQPTAQHSDSLAP